jgi:hypothetical protein
MQNFGKIKNVFNNLLIEGIIKKDDTTKKLFKKYVKTIKESEILKTQFLVYNNIENKIDSDSFSANIFVSENIKLMEKYKQSDILKENIKLKNILASESNKLNEDYELSKLHESISNLIFIKKTPKNVENVMAEIKSLATHITTNKTKTVTESIELPVGVLTNLMVDKYNKKYSTLEESDKETLKILIDNNVENKKNFYMKTLGECIDLVDNLLKESKDEYKEKLTKVKSKLQEDKEDTKEIDYLGKIFKLMELKNNLKN